jgi:hypothetical protein
MTTVFTNVSKNSASFSNQSRNTSAFTTFLKHGKDPIIGDLANTKFTDVVLEDGTQLKD